MTYSRAIATAKRVIASKGQVCTWQQNNMTASVQQPWKQTAAATTDTEVSIAFLKPQKTFGKAVEMLMRGTEVSTTSLRGLMAQVSFVPDIRDRVLRAGVYLNIVAITPIDVNGEVILYDIEFAG